MNNCNREKKYKRLGIKHSYGNGNIDREIRHLFIRMFPWTCAREGILDKGYSYWCAVDKYLQLNGNIVRNR